MTDLDWHKRRFDLERVQLDFFQRFESSRITPTTLDALLSDGWRHHGCSFFRDVYGQVGRRFSLILPLRLRVADCRLSKSQRRVMRTNSDLQVEFAAAGLDEDKRRLFDLHRRRFHENVPEKLEDFLGNQPAYIPCQVAECRVYLKRRLIAASFFDLTSSSLSSIYAIFDPAEESRSPGIFTLLCELEFARRSGLHHLYLGYAHADATHYDYKKRFDATEFYDWRGVWHPLHSFAERRPPVHPIEEVELHNPEGQNS